MYQTSDFSKATYKPSEIAKLLGISAQTIRNKISDGELACIYTEGGHRLIKKEDLLNYLLLSNHLSVTKLSEYRNLKKRLFHFQNRVNRKRNTIEKLKIQSIY